MRGKPLALTIYVTTVNRVRLSIVVKLHTTLSELVA